jgi:hypothetical protein
MRYDPPDLLSPPGVFARAFQRWADLLSRDRQRERDEARALRRRLAAQRREENRK